MKTRVDAASAAFFRISFGFLMLVEMVRYLSNNWIDVYFVRPPFHLKYCGFHWVHPMSGPLMHGLAVALAAAAFFVMIGFLYRASIVFVFLAFTYLFLIEAALYQNHLYLLCLISFAMIFVPANRAFAVDAARSKEPQTVPRWALWLLMFHVGLPYVYGAISKLDADWLSGVVTAGLLKGRGELFQQPATVFFFTYGGLVLDLLIVPFLLWRRTRPAAYMAALLFHLMNLALFRIGIFPWAMICFTTIFFEPDWPRRLLRLKPAVSPKKQVTAPRRGHTLAVAFFSVYVLFHLAWPLRHLIYPGDVNWTSEGYTFAWKMLARDRKSAVNFWVYDRATGKRERYPYEDLLLPVQGGSIRGDAQHMVQFAHYIAREARAAGRDVEVSADCRVSLNGRPLVRYNDPSINLAAEKLCRPHYRWILPLNVPAPDVKAIFEAPSTPPRPTPGTKQEFH